MTFELFEGKILPEGFTYHPEGYMWFVLPEKDFALLPETIDVNGKSIIEKMSFM